MTGHIRRAAILGTACALAACSGPTLPQLPEQHHGFSELPVDQSVASTLVSNYRESHKLAPVTIDPDLQHVAQAQADAMASANVLSHAVAGSLPERLAAQHVGRKASIENVSAGYADLPAALGGWQRSPEHNANLLFGPMRHIGIAAAEAPGTRYKRFWALVMTN